MGHRFYCYLMSVIYHYLRMFFFCMTQVLFEDETQNRMRESLALFENIISYPWFLEASIILFLNKTDLFHEKIPKSNLARHFPAYKGLFSLDEYCCFIVTLLSTMSPTTGPAGDPEAAKQFLLQLFLSVNPDPENKRIFSHFTQATDTENIKRVFQDVREHVLEENLKDYNLM